MPVAEAPAGWHRPSGPGGILDDPEVMYYGGRFHLFNSRKALEANDRNCTNYSNNNNNNNDQPNDHTNVADNGGVNKNNNDGEAPPTHCVEWRTSVDGVTFERRGVLTPPPPAPDGVGGNPMSETMSAMVYPNDTLVVMTDGGGMRAFTANATALLGDDVTKLVWSEGVNVEGYGGFNASFVAVALRVLPADLHAPKTHIAIGWHDHSGDGRSHEFSGGDISDGVAGVDGVDGADDVGGAVAANKSTPSKCNGGMTFAVFPLMMP